MMQLITTLVIGGLIGWVASLLAKSDNQMGCLWNIVVGILGAMLGTWLAGAVFHYYVQESTWNWPRFFVSVGGAVVLILGLRAIGLLRNR